MVKRRTENKMGKRILAGICCIGLLTAAGCSQNQEEPDPQELYQAAVEKNGELTDLDMTMGTRMTLEQAGETVDIDMNVDMLMSGYNTSDLQYQMETTTSLLGQNIEMTAFYTDGYYYMAVSYTHLEYTQAALVTTCLAMTKVVSEHGIRPDVTAGLSLGEYCAIAIAGGMSEEDAIRTVRKRGILMQNTVPAGEGAMAAVLGLEASAIEEVIADIEGVTIANYNCPGQIVITGVTAKVEEASEKLKAAGAKRVVMLNVSGPFHSPLLKSAGEELLKEMCIRDRTGEVL